MKIENLCVGSSSDIVYYENVDESWNLFEPWFLIIKLFLIIREWYSTGQEKSHPWPGFDAKGSTDVTRKRRVHSMLTADGEHKGKNVLFFSNISWCQLLERISYKFVYDHNT